MKTKPKIGIHLQNRDIHSVKLDNPELGNPGIGGTQFLMFSLPHYINKYLNKEFEFVLFAEYTETISSNCKVVSIENLPNAAIKAKEFNCDIFIFRPVYEKQTLEFLEIIKKLKLKAIGWLHNTPMFLLNHLYKNEQIVRCICVSRQQYETFRDHPIINKLSLIFNAIDYSQIPYNHSIPKNKTVVFLGALMYAKGFHILAKMWKKIIKYHPDAQLIVIGTGKLYNRDQKLGKFGLADEKYEKMFVKYILNEDGKILESISFLGVLGSEKFKYMSKARVGIANHPYLRETFCLGAVEFQLCGTAVVSRAYGGLLDTVQNGNSGILVSNMKDLRKSITKLLSDQDLAQQMGLKGRQFAVKKFNYELICKEWSRLFNDLMNNRSSVILINDFDTNLLNKLREFLRILKFNFSFFNIIPPTIYFLHTIEFIRLRLQKIYY